MEFHSCKRSDEQYIYGSTSYYRPEFQAEEMVRESKFTISPAIKADACKYCSYKDLCYKARAFKDRPKMKEEELEEAKKKEHEDEE